MADPDLDDLERRMKGAVEALRKELGGLRTGRASLSLLEPIVVEAYESKMPLNQVATINIPEPRMLSVQVWDKTQVKAVEKAIRSSDLGLNPIVDGQSLRIPIPELNEERRRELAKVAAKYTEQAKVATRNVRRDGMDQLKKIGKSGRPQRGRVAAVGDRDTGDDRRVRQENDRDVRVQGTRDLAGLDMALARSFADRQDPYLHVGIILDGNGRWARARGLPRTAGHRRGAEVVRKILKGCSSRGIRYLTIYAFSSENWKRPVGEVEDLMGLLRLYLRREVADLRGNGVQIAFIGDRSRLSKEINALISEAEESTRHNATLTLTVAVNYGGRQEIVDTVRRIAEQVRDGGLDADQISEETFQRHLQTRNLPDLDLVIRTSGEQRLSNFLLWQSAYTELVFVPTLWPDFTLEHLDEAIGEFQRRERRYGGARG